MEKKEQTIKNKIEKLYDKWKLEKSDNKSKVTEKEVGLVIEKKSCGKGTTQRIQLQQ